LLVTPLEAQMESKTLGFIGLGLIGAPMARRLLDHGYQLAVFDVREEALAPFRERGALVMASPAEVASNAEIVLVSLPTPAIVRAVALGADGIAAGSRVRVYIDLSTTGRATARDVAAGLAAAGIEALDSPVSGGIGGAERGALAMLVGGSGAVLERCRPILSTLGNIFHVGDAPGDGQMMKLVNNMLSATTLAATAEAVVVGVKAGLDPARLIEALNGGSGRTSASTDKFPRSVLNGTFAYGFKTGLMTKDLKLYLEEAEALGGALWMVSATNAVWNFHQAQNGPDSDNTEIVRLYEKWLGVECRETHEPAPAAP
jgi:3-hydroxyisobutyrate dehydrogenase-like beta-hydroxyacid dehydrogenase